MEGLHAITSKAVNIGMFKGASIREGVPVGCNMNRIDNWKCIVQKFASKLFWDEKWCGDMLLKDRFPRVFALEGDKNCNVADCLNISDWGSVFRRPPRGGVEASQFEDLQSLIQEMSTSISMMAGIGP
uniref:RNA-directed DNA polymerase, eukaryota, reverse transcriptase zinc-binding domain protein n=1 Tax=Tanacetum cinerariifolium TaxID=118510 RepID=A0A6L2M034_TANCI|nr:RNA-directed DNA polymerase, eukaryota, reverse transcriptase zinc-binding domain protein [Tanacetum cinerariifolium]